MPKKKRLNLITAISAINSFKKQPHAWVALSKVDRNKLLKIRNTLNIVIQVQKKWLQGDKGIIWQYNRAGITTHLTQENLLQEAKQAQLDSFKFVEKILTQLHFDLTSNKGLYFSLTSESILNATLPEIKEGITTVLMVNSRWKTTENIYDLSDYSSYYDNTEHIFQLVSYLNGRYLPTIQTLDTLKGMVYKEGKWIPAEGVCWGYVGSWSLNIEKYGKHIFMQRMDRQVIDFQESSVIHFQTLQTFTFTSAMDVWCHTEEIFNSVNTQYTYTIFFSTGARAHAMGLRKIPHTQEIEFYDPNFGIIVFPDMHAFKIWFANLYNMIYSGIFPQGTMKLKQLHAQLKHATPTVPVLKAMMPRKMQDDLLFPVYNNYFGNVFGFIDDVIASLHYWGYVDPLKINRDIENEWMETRALHLAKYVKSAVDDSKIHFNVKLLHRQLKNKVLDVIHDEQHRLMKQIFSPLNIFHKLKALDHLRLQIKKSPPGVSLKVAIDTWLKQKNKNGQSCRDVILAPRLSMFRKKTSTLNCIQNLLKHYEISPLVLSMMQDKVFLKVYESLVYIKNIHSPIFKVLFELIKGYEPVKDNAMPILFAIQQTAHAVKLPDMSTDLLKFYDAIAPLQPTDPSSLALTFNRLDF